MSPSERRIAAPLAVYDLDGVITRKDTFTALLIDRLRGSASRLIRAAPAVLAFAAGRTPDSRARSAQHIGRVALAGLREADYAALAARTGGRIGSEPSWIRRAIVERMRDQRRAGVRIIVATATERRLAEAVLRHADAPYDALSASSLIETPTGMVVEDHRVGARKAAALQEAGVVLSDAEFLTDSASDLPTARLAGRVLLVGASRRTHVRYLREGIAVESVPGG